VTSHLLHLPGCRQERQKGFRAGACGDQLLLRQRLRLPQPAQLNRPLLLLLLLVT
jgi:hypothetical protein